MSPQGPSPIRPDIPGLQPPQAKTQEPPPDSLIGRLRQTAAQKRERANLTLDLPGRWGPDGPTPLRVVYGMLDLDAIERFQESASGTATTANVAQSLILMAEAVKAIEAKDDTAESGWTVLEDAHGAVTFDDRLTRLLGWERPDDTYRFHPRQVYETMWDGNGILLSTHVAQVAQWMGLQEREVQRLGEALNRPGSTSPPPPPPSAPTRE
jgi:hypothetical protein